MAKKTQETFCCSVIQGLCDKNPQGVCATGVEEKDVCNHAWKYLMINLPRLGITGRVTIKTIQNGIKITSLEKDNSLGVQNGDSIRQLTSLQS